MHLLPYPYEFCEVLSGSNSKWSTYRHFCLLKLTKYFKILSVRMNISSTNKHFFPILYSCINYPSSHESCEVSSGSNSKWPTYLYFCLPKLTKYLKILSVRMNISNTNEHFFPILYTCINDNPPMNPVKFCPDQVQNGRLIAIFVCLN